MRETTNEPIFADAGEIITDLTRRLAEVTAERDDYVEVLQDKRRLAREIDVAMHGETGAAKQASLCDLIEPAINLRVRAETAEAALSRRDEALRVAREALVEGKVAILQLKNARWSEAEGSDAEWVGALSSAIAALDALTKPQEAADAGENG
jgi:predicted translin family RNA/ssDNA-binding protein